MIGDVMELKEIKARFRACLLGGAVGDALGASVEFDSLARIRAQYGEAGVRDYGPDPLSEGKITDDTQMTLYTAAALLDDGAGVLDGHGNEAMLGRSLCSAYLRWLRSQGPASNVRTMSGRATGLLEGWPGMRESRAPGLTCLSALASLTSLEACTAQNDRKGCGGVMRVAPVGLWSLGSPAPAAMACTWGRVAAAITHGHPTGYLAAAATAVIVEELARHQSLHEALRVADQCLAADPESGETRLALAAAVQLAQKGVASAECLETLGGGWVAEEALAIAVYCALVAPDFESGVILAANHSGDSDSTASVAGQFLGLMHGLAAIPQRWLTTLELRELVVETADALAAQVAERGGLDRM